MSSVYITKVGNTIRDVCINGSGSMQNWDVICQANGFDTWTPAFAPGSMVLIPDAAKIDANTLQDKSGYPSSNTGRADALAILQTVWDLITDRWILKGGFWDDTGIWIDNDSWKDNP